MREDPDLEKKVMDHYQKGEGSLQQIAIFYKIPVERVLQIIGQEEMLEVETQGDLVDANEVGPEVQLHHSKKFKVPYDIGN